MAEWKTEKLPKPVTRDLKLTEPATQWACEAIDVAAAFDSVRTAYGQYRAMSHDAPLFEDYVYFEPDSNQAGFIWVDESGCYRSKLML